MEYIVLTGVFRKKGRRWLADCPELGTATFGRSLTEAEARLREAIELHVNTLEDVGEADRFFGEHGIKIHNEDLAKTTISIDAPVEPDTFVRPLRTPLRQKEPELVA